MTNFLKSIQLILLILFSTQLSSFLLSYYHVYYPSAALIGENILYFGGGANNSNGVSVLKIGASAYGKYSVCGTDIIIDYSDLAVHLFFILYLFIFRSCLEK
jgi:hypothetical protein